MNVDTDTLFGIFVATSEPGWNLEHDAWEGRFKFQVRVKLVTNRMYEIKDASRMFKDLGLKVARVSPVYASYGPP